SSTTRPRRSPSGSAATTAPRSSGSSRWIDGVTCPAAGLPSAGGALRSLKGRSKIFQTEIAMLNKTLSFATAALALTLSVWAATSSQAQSQSPAALTGTVSSAKEGLMEGVVVSAKRAGSTVTVSVATQDEGRFSFPASRLEPGQYALTTRAIGYDLEGPKT